MSLVNAETTSTSSRRVLLVSNYNAIKRPFNGVVYDFMQLIASVEQATIAAPLARRYLEPVLGEVAREYTSVQNELISGVRRAVGLPSVARTQRSPVVGDFDLCFCMCQFPRHLPDIDRVCDWRKRSAKACLFILEGWPRSLQKFKADLRFLDQFDHIFVLNTHDIAALRGHTSTPVSFLPTAADCLACGAGSDSPERCIDFLSLGRREKVTHAVLCDHAARHGRFYVFDPWLGLTARDWADARRMSAELIRRANYYVAWAPAPVLALKRKELVLQGVLSTRYFEGAAGGAVLIGSRPATPDFDALFDWPDAVIELPSEAGEIGSAIRALEAQPERRAEASRNNREQSLRRHDWAYRWAAVLQTLGLEPTEALDARIGLLQRLADEVGAADTAGQFPRLATTSDL